MLGLSRRNFPSKSGKFESTRGDCPIEIREVGSSRRKSSLNLSQAWFREKGIPPENRGSLDLGEGSLGLGEGKLGLREANLGLQRGIVGLNAGSTGSELLPGSATCRGCADPGEIRLTGPRWLRQVALHFNGEFTDGRRPQPAV